ncbi:hypothetical protein [Acrocarpospora catenulata]|uniref:hypothetical protein n=1 Tax=Acrocarpospora catenulata TaxID=2836182 RepID=UPI001BD9AC0B|nr:hypothetical protein [Acrocarpospora catenulata]
MADRCELTELIREQCAHCRPAPPPEPRLYGRWFAAQFPGDCAGCGERFEEGDEIRWDGEGGYLAECCGGDDA